MPIVGPAKSPSYGPEEEACKSPSPFRDKGIHLTRDSKICSLEMEVKEENDCRDDILGVNFPHLVDANRCDDNPSTQSPSPLFFVFGQPLIYGGSSGIGGSFGSDVGNMEPLRVVAADGSEWGMEPGISGDWSMVLMSGVWGLPLLWAKRRRDSGVTIIGQRRILHDFKRFEV